MDTALNSSDALQRACHWLDRAGLRPTRQRLTLAELLVGDGQNRHITAEGLHEAAAGSATPVSLATVYNTLRAFCDAGLLSEIAIEGHSTYFDTRTDDHPHFFWEDTGALIDAPANSVQFSSLPDAPQGAEIAKVDVFIRLRTKP